MRFAFSLLEMAVATAITAMIGAVLATSVIAATKTRDTASNRLDADAGVNRVVQQVAAELRFADVNNIYLDRTTWTTTVSGVDYYSFKKATGFTTAGVASMDQLVQYGTGVILRFQRASATSDFGELARQEATLDSAGVPTGYGPWIVLTDKLAWNWRSSAAGAAKPGFQVTQTIQSSTTIIGNKLTVTGAARPWDAVVQYDASGNAEYNAATIGSSSDVFLRSTMYNGYGMTAPVISGPTTASAALSTAFQADILATQTPTWYGATNLPAGLTVNSATGRISGTPTASGTFNCTLTATNSAGSGTGTMALTVTQPVPTVTSETLSATVGVTYSRQVTATQSPTAWTANNLAPGLSINSTTGVISGTPTTVGTWTSTVTAANSYGSGSGTLQFTITSGPPTAPPDITSPSTATGVVDTTYATLYVIQATNAPTSYNASGLPTGLSINTVTGVISGKVTSAYSGTIGVTAVNSIGTGVKYVTLTMTAVPVITSSLTSTATVGTAWTYTITASGSPTQYTATNLPSWATGTQVITGTPTVPGTVTMTIGASNAAGSDSESLTVTVEAAPTPVISSTLTATGYVNSVFTYTILAENGPHTSYSASNLPTWLRRSEATLSGTPTTRQDEGTYTIPISATNNAGTGNATLSILISPAIANPTITHEIRETGRRTNIFEVIGTITPGNGQTLNYATFRSVAIKGATVQTMSNPINKGWENPVGLSAYQFKYTVTNPESGWKVESSISDTAGRASGTQIANP